MMNNLTLGVEQEAFAEFYQLFGETIYDEAPHPRRRKRDS